MMKDVFELVPTHASKQASYRDGQTVLSSVPRMRTCTVVGSTLAHFYMRISQNPRKVFLVNSVCEICGLRPAATRWGQHTQRERGKAKYPSILGGRETHEIRKERAEGRIGSYAYGDRVMSCRHARSLARSPGRPLAHFQTHLRSCTLTRVEKSKNGPAHSPLDRPRCPLLPSSTMEAWMDGWIGGIDFRKHLTPSPSQSGGGGRTYPMSKFSAEIDPSLTKRQVSDRPTFMEGVCFFCALCCAPIPF